MTSFGFAARFGGTAVAILLSATLACDGGSGSSGVPAATTLASLTAAQKTALCDYVNNAQGGYGKTATCPSGETSSDPSQQACVAAIPLVADACPELTAGDFESCANATGTNQCAFDTAPACQNLRDCMNSV